MKAVKYAGPYQVTVADVPEPKIEAPGDAIVRITTTNICGSDLHMYEGRTSVEEGKVLGHENLGIVEDAGSAVTRVNGNGPVAASCRALGRLMGPRCPQSATPAAADAPGRRLTQFCHI